MTPLLLRGARLLDPDSGLDAVGDLLVGEDGRIAALGPGRIAPPEGAEVADASGLALAPGLVDMRAQLREPGEEHKETIETAMRAAVAGGVTTVIALPTTTPPVDDAALVESIARRARQVRLARVETYALATRGGRGRELTEMGLLAEAGAVGFTDGVTAIADAAVMRRALGYARTFGALLLQHPQEAALAAGGAMNEGEVATRLGLPGIPAAAEVIQVERDIRLLELTGGRLHFGPVSTEAAIDAIRRAKARGLALTCDTAPPYFALNETAVGEYRSFAKLTPPLRGEWDRRAVVAGLADGTIDAISSDHAPHDQDSKRLPFTSAEPGVLGLETLLPVSLELVHNRQVDLRRVLRALTAVPAGILGLAAGRLAVGAPADLVLVDLDKPWRVDVDAFRSKSKNSPFEGRPVQGRAIGTFIEGRRVFAIGE